MTGLALTTSLLLLLAAIFLVATLRSPRLAPYKTVASVILIVAAVLSLIVSIVSITGG